MCSVPVSKMSFALVENYIALSDLSFHHNSKRFHTELSNCVFQFNSNKKLSPLSLSFFLGWLLDLYGAHVYLVW